MTLEESKELVIQALTRIQRGSGRSVPEVHEDLCPIGDFEGFDSLNAIEAANLLSEYLACKIKPDLMLSTYPGKQLTLREIAERLQRTISAREDH